MPVAIANTHFATSTGASTTATVSVTRAAGEGLIACVFRENTGGASVDTVSSVVWDAAGDNQSFTFIRTQQESSSASRYIGLYYLPAPTSVKTANVTVTFSGSTLHDNDAILVRRITGHDTASMIRGSAGFNQVTFNNVTPVSDSLASAVGDLVIDFFSTRLGVAEQAATTGQGDISENTAQFSRSVSSSSKAGAASTTIGWESTNATSFSQAHVILSVQPAAGDTTAPVLTSPTGVATGATTATVGATTDEGNGTMYAVVTTSATQPSVAQIKAAQDHTGAAAPWGGSVAVSSTGAKTLNATGLTFGTVYYAHVVHTDAAANDSNRVSSSAFDAVIRPNADVSVTGWTSTGATVYEVIDEATPSDADYATSPAITGTGAPAILGLKNGPLAAGNWSPPVRAAVSSGTATLRISLVNDANAAQGSVDITVNSTITRYDPTITTTGQATRIKFEFFS